MTPAMEAAYHAALDTALQIGQHILERGGSSLDAVTQTIIYLENCPLFNAGRGAVFNHDGVNELDAGLMDGHTRKAGAAGAVVGVKNPILLARKIMENSPHVLLTGGGAAEFARMQGLEMAGPEWFFTEKRWQAWQKALQEEKAVRPAPDATQPAEKKMGTVGCVALDRAGHLAAGTSTGGMTNKRWNRLGDTPVIGAGTYAADDGCAVSCTGHGEYFIRLAVAHDLWAQMVYGGRSLREAANYIVYEKLPAYGGEGGLIAVDKHGNIALPFNTTGMYRGSVKNGLRQTAIYR